MADVAYKGPSDSNESTPTNTRPPSLPDIMPSIRKFAAPACGCEIIHSSSETLAELRNLPAHAIILLLTPVIAAPDMRQAVDPFEALGRELSTRHARVRHVPYIAKVGFTETHKVFMQRADAIIIASNDSPPSTSQLFSDDTELNDSVFEFVIPASSAPLVCIQFGGTAVKTEEMTHEIYLKASHASHETFQLATCLLFGAGD